MTQLRRFTEADHDKTIDVAVGEAIEVAVVDIPSTGYTWSLTAPAGALEVAERLEDPEAASGRPGRPGLHVYALTAMRPGQIEVRLVQRRSWEAESPTDTTVRITLDVR